MERLTTGEAITDPSSCSEGERYIEADRERGVGFAVFSRLLAVSAVIKSCTNEEAISHSSST